MQSNQSHRIGCVLAIAFLNSCIAAPESRPLSADVSVPVRIMAFNIELGGAFVSFDSVVAAIQAAAPDIVVVQEPYGQLPKLAERLGWHFDLRNHIVSKVPLIDPQSADGNYLLAEIVPGRVIAVANVHLPSDPYGEDWIRDGRSHDDVIKLEHDVRVPYIRAFLDVLPTLAARGMPVFMAGDFNSPAGSDWQPGSIARYPFRRYTVDWPVAKAITAAGFHDSYRELYPDPLAKPGFTWWASRPPNSGYDPEGEGAWQSRIDFIWHAGPARIKDIRIVGEPGAPVTDLAIAPWPSDHRALVGDFDVVPSSLPVFIATEQRVVTSDAPAVARYNNTTGSGYIDMSRTDEPDHGSRINLTTQQGQVALRGLVQADGEYQLRLHDESGAIVGETRYWYQGDDARPRLIVMQDSPACEAGLLATWSDAPGHRYDWLGIFSPDDAEARAWLHINAAIDGDACLDATSLTGTWPLLPGHYVLRLLLDDSYQLIAESLSFQIN